MARTEEDPVVYGSGTCALGGHPAKPDQLMCAQHWRMVPRHLQNQVNTAWSFWLAGGTSLHELRSVQDVAVAAVREREAR